MQARSCTSSGRLTRPVVRVDLCYEITRSALALAPVPPFVRKADADARLGADLQQKVTRHLRGVVAVNFFAGISAAEELHDVLDRHFVQQG